MSDGSPAVPRHSAVLGLTMFACIALPLVDDTSVLDWLVSVVQREPISALSFLVTIGSPFLFGLAVAFAGVLRDPGLAASTIRLPLVFVHTTLALYAFILARWPDPVPLRWPFVGFVAVASAGFLFQNAAADAAGRPLGPRFLARWGGVLVAGAAAWIHLHTVNGRPFGPALTLLLIAAALLAATTPRDPQPVPEDSQ